MSQWSLDNPPSFPYLGEKKPVATERGWEHPVTGELLVTIRGLATKASAANVAGVVFGASEYERGDNLSLKVIYNEKVNVSAGSTLVVTSAAGSNITLKAAAQNGVQEVVYDKKNSDGTTQETVPDRADTYSIGAQTLGGTIVDTLGGVAATGTLTVTDNPVADETVTIDSVVYTFKSTVSTTAGQVKIGATKEISMDNLAAAINADSSAGSGVYGSSTTAHTTVSAVAVDATVVVTAKTKGTAGNSLATTETLTNGAWGGSTLASGAATSTSAKTVSSGVAALTGTRVLASGAITEVAFDDAVSAPGETFSVTVTFDQTVDVTAGANIELTSDDGSHPTLNIYAAAQTNVTEVVFDKISDNTTAIVFPQTIAASGTLTNDGVNVSNGDTVTIGSKTYTFQSSLTNVDGNVKIGASNTASMTNLFHAINASGGTPGTDYAAATVAHTQVTATNPSGTTVVVTAITAGTAGNSIATTEASTHLSWGGAVLSGGVTHATTSLTIEAQEIDGTIVDHNTTSISADLTISAAVAAAAGEKTSS